MSDDARSGRWTVAGLGHSPPWRRRLHGAGGSRYVVQLATVVLACAFADRLSTWAITVINIFDLRSLWVSPNPEGLYATSLSTGVATGALVVMGVRVWPAIAVGMFWGTVAPPSLVGIEPALIMTAGHTIGSLTFWWLANRYESGLTIFPRVGSVVRFSANALVSAVVVGLSSIVTRVIGTGMISQWHFPWAALPTSVGLFEHWLVTFLRVFVGIIIVTPVITLWSRGTPWRQNLRRTREFAAVLAAVALTSWLWWIGHYQVGDIPYLSFLVLPVLLWTALRLGVRETVTASLVMTMVALTGTGLGYGPFVFGSTMASLLSLQLSLALYALGALAVAAEVGRREASEAEVRKLNEDLEHRASVRAQELVRAHARLRRARVKHAAAIRHVHARIASDLHDSVGASLSRIAILSDLALRESEATATVTTGALTKIGDNARAVIDEMSDAVWFVDPKMEDIQQMVVRLRSVAGALFEANGTDWEIDASPELLPLTLTTDQRRHLFLILKEALTNVHRHAHATVVRVVITSTDSGLRAVVDDNGTGMVAAHTGPGHGNGLTNMQKRARELAGTLSIQSRPAFDGTRIIVDVPLQS